MKCCARVIYNMYILAYWLKAKLIKYLLRCSDTKLVSILSTCKQFLELCLQKLKSLFKYR